MAPRRAARGGARRRAAKIGNFVTYIPRARAPVPGTVTHAVSYRRPGIAIRGALEDRAGYAPLVDPATGVVRLSLGRPVERELTPGEKEAKYRLEIAKAAQANLDRRGRAEDIGREERRLRAGHTQVLRNLLINEERERLLGVQHANRVAQDLHEAQARTRFEEDRRLAAEREAAERRLAAEREAAERPYAAARAAEQESRDRAMLYELSPAGRADAAQRTARLVERGERAVAAQALRERFAAPAPMNAVERRRAVLAAARDRVEAASASAREASARTADMLRVARTPTSADLITAANARTRALKQAQAAERASAAYGDYIGEDVPGTSSHTLDDLYDAAERAALLAYYSDRRTIEAQIAHPGLNPGEINQLRELLAARNALLKQQHPALTDARIAMFSSSAAAGAGRRRRRGGLALPNPRLSKSVWSRPMFTPILPFPVGGIRIQRPGGFMGVGRSGFARPA